jgi:hypothetical protein
MCGSRESARAYSAAFVGDGSATASLSMRRCVAAFAPVYPGIAGGFCATVAPRPPIATIDATNRLRTTNEMD